MSFRRYSAGIVAMSVVALYGATNFVDHRLSKRTRLMTTQNYMADSLQEHERPQISQHDLQNEIDRMMADAQQRGKEFEIKRIERPKLDTEPEKPRRFDQYDVNSHPNAQ